MVSRHSGQVPRFVVPMAAQPVKQLPEGEEWMYELKLDGYRGLILKNGPDARIYSRNNNDLTGSYPAIAAAAVRVNAERATIDGEIVALDENGRPSFQQLQNRSRHTKLTTAFYAFDLLHLNGRDLTGEPLAVRREKLPAVIESSGLRLSVELPGSAAAVTAAVSAQGLEGVVAKRRSSLYQPGERSDSWVKLKIDRQQEFVVGGYRPDGDVFDSLVIGYYDEGKLRFAAKVRNGFVPHVRRELARKLKPLRVTTCPFADLPNARSGRTRSGWSGGGITPEEMRELRWVKPELVVQIGYTELTDEGRLRKANYIGLRTDKAARDVRREL